MKKKNNILKLQEQLQQITILQQKRLKGGEMVEADPNLIDDE